MIKDIERPRYNEDDNRLHYRVIDSDTGILLGYEYFDLNVVPVNEYKDVAIGVIGVVGDEYYKWGKGSNVNKERHILMGGIVIKDGKDPNRDIKYNVYLNDIVVIDTIEYIVSEDGLGLVVLYPTNFKSNIKPIYPHLEDIASFAIKGRQFSS